MAPGRHSAEPAGVARVDRQIQGDRRDPPASTGDRANTPRGGGRPPELRCTGGMGWRCRQGRPTPAHIHLLPPGVAHRRADRPFVARGVRIDHGGDLPFLPRRCRDDEETHLPRQSNHPGKRDTLRGPVPFRTRGTPRRSAPRHLPRLQRGIFGYFRYGASPA